MQSITLPEAKGADNFQIDATPVCSQMPEPHPIQL